MEREKIASEKQIAEIHARELLRSNGTLRTLSEASASGERVTLESLLSDEQRDFSVPSSHEPFDPQRTPREFLPSRPISRTPAGNRADWLEDEDVTELRSPRGDDR